MLQGCCLDGIDSGPWVVVSEWAASGCIDRGLVGSRSRMAQVVSWWKCLTSARFHTLVKMWCFGAETQSDRVSVQENNFVRPIDVLLIDNSFDITLMILLLCFDILSDQIIISSPFCHFLVYKYLLINKLSRDHS